MTAARVGDECAPSGADQASMARRHAWLGALRQLAQADDQIDAAEQSQLEVLLAAELPGESLEQLPLPGDAALCHRLGIGTSIAEEFLRSAVILALADGYLSEREVELLRHWSQLLAVGEDLVGKLESDCGDSPNPNHHLLDPLRHWLDAIHPHDPAVAELLVKLIPAQCPFERDVVILGRKVGHIPPMCKVNPLYDELMGLRFRCLCFLEGEDVPPATADPTAYD
ncbi:Mo-dependent nitrogenase C-terminal domain-containing protein [Vulcanococcus limneticus]|uniref:Mo-dependent nitrogenase C-terminal domain-containing protein n=2 Tax=Vulcanococcus limneticus TaxID=2170428 RepID=UPI0020CE99F3|nr:Mo-dependent nitrogenase C-terminal domain-containing protein [Vulcanococcus limneticus]